MRQPVKAAVVVDIMLIVLLAFAGYGFICRSGEMPYSVHSDIVAEHLGTKTVLYRAWTERGAVPFWRSDQFSGYTALTNPQSLYTFPLHFLFYFMRPENAIGWTLWLQFVVAALGFYLVGAVLDLGRWARLLMAVAALFSFKLVIAAYAGWLPIIPGIITFSLFFAAVFFLVKRPGWRSTLAIAAAGTLCLHTGHLQFFYYAALFSFAYLAVELVKRLRAGQRRAARSIVVSLLCGTAIAVGCSAYLYIPLLAEIPLISRGKATYDFFLANHAFTPRHLLTFLYPEAMGNPLDGSYAGIELWEDVGYFGIVPLLLAVLGAVWGWRRPTTRFLAFSFLAAVVMAMDTPLLRLLYAAVPGFHLFRCPSRFLFLSAFFGITLAGIGLDELIIRLRGKHHRSSVVFSLVLGLLLVVILEGIFYARRYLGTVPRGQVVPESEYGRFLASDTALYRIAPTMRYSVNYGWAAPMGLQMVTGYDSFNFRHYQEYFDILRVGTISKGGARVWADLSSIARWDLLDALNVKYIVSAAPMDLPGERFQKAAHWDNQPIFVFYRGMARGPIYLYENKKFLQRAFWVGEVVAVSDEREMVARMNLEELTRVGVIIDRAGGRFPCAGSSEDRVEVLEASDGYLALRIKNRSRRFLVISEIWHPGWRAFLDENEIHLFQTDLALLGAWIPPGEHRLVLRFRPLYWSLALGISVLSGGIFLLLLVGLCIGMFRTGRGDRSVPGGERSVS
jgi:hypothetical protein